MIVIPDVVIMEELSDVIDFVAMHREAGWLLLTQEELSEDEMVKVIQIINNDPAPNMIVKPAAKTDFDYTWPLGLRLWN